MSVQSTVSALRAVLVDALEHDSSVVVVQQSTDGPLGAFPEDRVVCVPVADGAAVALAVGLAAGGRRPVLELADTGRLASVVEALADAVRLQGGEVSCPVVVRVPWGAEATGIDTPIGAWLDALEGVDVVCPSTPGQAAALLRRALTTSRPTLILEPRRLYRRTGPADDAVGCRVVREGHHVTLVAVGSDVDVAVEAADALHEAGVSAEVVDLVMLQPLDASTLGASVRRTGRLLVVHSDDPALARRVREAALEAAFLYLEAPLASASGEALALADAARRLVEY